jgi:predicted SnoaL-like aldol condensation-catalyzing enzyme
VRRWCSVGTDENKAVLRRIVDEVITGKSLDMADELFSEEHELHPEVPGIGRGPEGMKRAFAGLHEEFPDVRVEIEAMVAEADMVAMRLTFSGTHAPTGERATWPEMVFTRFAGGKAVESWEVTDSGRSWDSAPW